MRRQKYSHCADSRIWLQELGKHPVIVPEAATELIMAGIKPWELTPEVFQEALLRLQVRREQIYAQAIQHKDTPTQDVVILLDRGAIDAAAYVGKKEFAEIVQKLGLTFTQLRDENYDGVLHLVTAADGAEKFYTCANNQARTETPQQARELDKAIQGVWVGHPHLRVIGNYGDGWQGKLKRLKQEVAAILGVPQPIERERKFLLKSVPDIPGSVHSAHVEIIQHYLRVRPGFSERVRKRTGEDGHSVFTHTIKTSTGKPGENTELERIITLQEYNSKLEGPLKGYTQKTRICFLWEHQYFELDVFAKPAGLCLLEIEQTQESQTLILPEWVRDVLDREVTGDTRYSNAYLATQ